MTVWEVSQLVVGQGTEDEFESTIRSHLPILKEAEGCLDVKLLRAVDKEGTFLLFIEWQSVEHHTEVFLKTEGFATFSGAVTPFLTEPPAVLHAVKVIDGFGG
jgi:quinol monooxygenase YgiN